MTSKLCLIGFHRWARRVATLRPTRLVRRCRACGKVVVAKRRAG